MKIMIVDDEVIIRDGLAKVINWHDLGLELLTPAASAEEVLSRLPTERPDILLTDIRMGGKTGLEVAGEAREIVPDLEIIILSGYDDFIYMQNAIRQNVSDYLLKTSRPDEIIRTVLQVKQRIEERRVAESKGRYKDLAEQRRLIERWITLGDQTEVSEQLISTVFSPLYENGQTRITSSSLCVLFIAAEGWDSMKSMQSLLLFAVDNVLKELLNCVSFVQKNRVMVIVRSAESSSERQQQRSIFQKIEHVLKCRLFIIRGNPAHNPANLHESYESAELAFGFKPLLAATEWGYSDIKHRKGGRTVCAHEEEKELFSIMLDGSPLVLKRWVQDFVQDLKNELDVTPQSFAASIQSVSFAAQRWLNRVVESLGTGVNSEMSHTSLQYEGDQAPDDVLFLYLYQIMKVYHNQLSQGQISHVHKAIAYIQEHIGDDLSLQQVANYVHLHPVHLSTLFSKESGLTFRDFVMKTKMEHAMDMLTTSPLKISEIAEGVGYDNVKYFGQIFKKYTGKTPSDYREDMQSHIRG